MTERFSGHEGPERPTDAKRVERYVNLGASEAEAYNVGELERIALERRERQQPLHPRLYIRSTIDQSRGDEVGGWIAAARDADTMTADILAVLSRSLATRRTGTAVGEWEIGGSEDFEQAEPDKHESLPVVSALAKGIAQYGPAFAAWASIGHELQGHYDVAIMQRFPDAYIGDFASIQTYAEHVIVQRGAVEAIEQLPEWLQHITRLDWHGLIQHIEWNGDIHVVDHDNGIWVFDSRSTLAPTNHQDTKGGEHA
ncbi:antirestriction protein ArdA [Kribbella sp. NPDC051620]|uniref:antirestriction protein ArdA n=1 Tax=Kribbella sp. NPDC051620 TaxID=3364120 RepID=UPI0037B6E19F